MKSVSASHLQHARWNSLLPKGLAKLWILNFNISINCFKKNTVFPSVSSNFLEFRMFWHVPFQELQVSKRNRHFEQNFQLSQHLFPVPFFPLRSGCPWRIVLLRLWRLWASLLECGHPWDAWHIQTTSTSNIQTPNKNITHCEVKLLPCRVSKQRVQLLWQKSWYFYHRKHRNMSSGWSFPDQFTAVSKTSMKLP